MFEQIGARYDANLNDVPAVGDSLRDLQASSAAGCAPWLVLTGNGAKTQAKGGLPPGTRICDDLSAVVDLLLYKTKRPDPMARLRSLLYAIFLIVTVIPYAFACVLGAAAAAPALQAHRGLAAPGDLGRARDLRHPLAGEGLGKPARRPGRDPVKHQSAWETLFFPAYMPREVCFVYKKELHMVPFFGWAWRCCA